MTEFSAEQIKDVQALNLIHTVGTHIEAIGDAIKHIGNDIHAILNDSESVLTEEQTGEYKHWLGICSNIMEAVSKSIQINQIAMDLHGSVADGMPENEKKEIRDLVEQTEPLVKVKEIMSESVEDTLMRLMMDMIGGTISKEEFEKNVNGN